MADGLRERIFDSRVLLKKIVCETFIWREKETRYLFYYGFRLPFKHETNN